MSVIDREDEAKLCPNLRDIWSCDWTSVLLCAADLGYKVDVGADSGILNNQRWFQP